MLNINRGVCVFFYKVRFESKQSKTFLRSTQWKHNVPHSAWAQGQQVCAYAILIKFDITAYAVLLVLFVELDRVKQWVI